MIFLIQNRIQTRNEGKPYCIKLLKKFQSNVKWKSPDERISRVWKSYLKVLFGKVFIWRGFFLSLMRNRKIFSVLSFNKLIDSCDKLSVLQSINLILLHATLGCGIHVNIFINYFQKDGLNLKNSYNRSKVRALQDLMD